MAKEQYTHRNGETDPPEIMGYYWFVGKINGVKSRAHDGQHYEMILLLPYQISIGSKLVLRKDIADARWWGPVDMPVPPWEQDNG